MLPTSATLIRGFEDRSASMKQSFAFACLNLYSSRELFAPNTSIQCTLFSLEMGLSLEIRVRLPRGQCPPAISAHSFSLSPQL